VVELSGKERDDMEGNLRADGGSTTAGSRAERAVRWWSGAQWVIRIMTACAVVWMLGGDRLEREHPDLLLEFLDPESARVIERMEPVGLRGYWYLAGVRWSRDNIVVSLALGQTNAPDVDTNWCVRIEDEVRSQNWFLPQMSNYWRAIEQGGVSLYYERICVVNGCIVLTNGVMVLRNGEVLYHYPPLGSLASPRVVGEVSDGVEPPPWRRKGKGR